MIVIHARLPAEQGEVIRQALEAAMQSLEEPGSEAEVDTGADSAASGNRAAGASAESPGPGYPRPRFLRDDPDTSNDPRTESRRPLAARRADALFHLSRCYLDSAAERCPSSSPRYQVVVRIDQSLLSHALGEARRLDSVPVREAHDSVSGCCELEHGPALAIDTARRLACHSSLVGIVHDGAGNPLDVGRKTRAIPAALERALKERDGGCRFPGCDRTRFTEGHHVRHWADGGETKLSNLITLCHFHHRLLHEGGFRLQVTDDAEFVFSTPDGQAVQAAALQSNRRFRGNIADLNARRGISVRRPPGWNGDRMDSSLVIDGLLWARERTRPEVGH